MRVRGAGSSQERIDPESASIRYSVRYTGIVICSVLGVATVVLSLFLFTKLVLKASEDVAARKKMRAQQREAAKSNATETKTTKNLDDLIRSFFNHSPTESEEGNTNAAGFGNRSAYRPRLGAGMGNSDQGDADYEVQIPLMPLPGAPTTATTTTTPSALGLGATEAVSVERFYGRKSHLEDSAVPQRDRPEGDDDVDSKLAANEYAASPSMSAGIWE